MNNMKKLISLLAAGILVSLTMIGCGTAEDTGTNAADTTTNTTTDVANATPAANTDNAANTDAGNASNGG